MLSAILIATAVDGPAEWFERRGIRRPLAVTLLFLSTGSIGVVVVVAAVPLIQTELATLQDHIETVTARIRERIGAWGLGQMVVAGPSGIAMGFWHSVRALAGDHRGGAGAGAVS